LLPDGKVLVTAGVGRIIGVTDSVDDLTPKKRT
jgi:hypothetical protein